MPRYKLNIEYRGTNFHGWQIQPGEKTVQGDIGEALRTAIGPIENFQGSGRTDAGVHARGQVAHFDSENTLDTYRLRSSLNGILDSDIAIRDVLEENPDFHARYDARFRRYRYHLCDNFAALDMQTRTRVKQVIDLELLRQASTVLLGKHHFGSFCKTASATENRHCEIFQILWQEEDHPNMYFFEIVGDRFLHGMVRAIVGTLLEIGRGKREHDNIIYLLEANDRKQAGSAAPARGLVLEEVSYTDWTVGNE